MVICSDNKSIRTMWMVTTVLYTGLISFCCLASLQTFMCSLTSIFYEHVSYLAVIFAVILLRAWISVTLIGKVGLSSLPRLVSLQTFICSQSLSFFQVVSYVVIMFE